MVLLPQFFVYLLTAMDDVQSIHQLADMWVRDAELPTFYLYFGGIQNSY